MASDSANTLPVMQVGVTRETGWGSGQKRAGVAMRCPHNQEGEGGRQGGECGEERRR